MYPNCVINPPALESPSPVSIYMILGFAFEITKPDTPNDGRLSVRLFHVEPPFKVPHKPPAGVPMKIIFAFDGWKIILSTRPIPLKSAKLFCKGEEDGPINVQ